MQTQLESPAEETTNYLNVERCNGMLTLKAYVLALTGSTHMHLSAIVNQMGDVNRCAHSKAGVNRAKLAASPARTIVPKPHNCS